MQFFLDKKKNETFARYRFVLSVQRNSFFYIFLWNRFAEIWRSWHIALVFQGASTFNPRKILEIFWSVSRGAERSCRRAFGGFASLRSRRQTIQRSLPPSVRSTPRRYTSRGIPYAPSIFMGLSTYCQTYWAWANGRRHARNSWIFKQVTKQSSFALAPAPGTDTPPGHQAVPYYLIAYWAEMELSYSIQLRVRIGTLGPICDQELRAKTIWIISAYFLSVLLTIWKYKCFWK